MRLTDLEISKIRNVLSSFSTENKIYLHGSRIEDSKKGGDIDLFYVIPDDIYEELKGIKHKIAAELSIALNEQKVDLIILSKSNIRTNTFFNNSFKELLPNFDSI